MQCPIIWVSVASDMRVLRGCSAEDNKSSGIDKVNAL